ncbi:MAG: hypothetical protein IRY86_12740, partial [Thermorudis peleae]|nr:hypothetical protein [Thermorudis peleae]
GDANGRRSTALEEIVDRVIHERLEDGQLDECDLTLRELGEIRRVFLTILEGIYHPRIEYPETPRPAVAADDGNLAPAPVAGQTA